MEAWITVVNCWKKLTGFTTFVLKVFPEQQLCVVPATETICFSLQLLQIKCM